MSETIILEFDSGPLSLQKITHLTAGAYGKIRSKIKLSGNSFRTYVLYYAQENYHSSSKYSFDSFRVIDTEIVDKLFLAYTRSDEKLISEYNQGQTVKDIDAAERLVKEFLQSSANKLGTAMLAMFLQTSITHLWVVSIKGNLTVEDVDRLNDLSSAFNQGVSAHSEYFDYVPPAAVISFQEFHEQKEVFIETCKYVNLIIEKLRLAEIWIPTRFLNKVFADLISLNLTGSNPSQLYKIIFQYYEPDFGKILMDDWKKSELFIGKHEILEQTFEAQRRKLYAPAITCFLTILDFVGLEISDAIGQKTNERNINIKLLKGILIFLQDKINWDMPVNEFFPDTNLHSEGLLFLQIETMLQYLTNIVFSDTDKHDGQNFILNRHGILHGKFFDYPTEINAKKLILLLDDLILLHRRFSEKV